jgi:N-ethylmaleimide reductase
MENQLFTPWKLGDLSLSNRIVMAPLTRRRASSGFVANEMMARYYGLRASAGLIIAEATMVHRTGQGYPDTPGIWSKEQVESWKPVTGIVHEKGGRIYLQLWHVGRYSHPLLQENGALPVSASAVRIDGVINTPEGYKDHVTPRALKIEEIPEVVDWYAKGARNAIEAGFDGVEIHGANSYLIDQFLQDGVNKRTDSYGGPLENRVRFGLEVVEAVVSEIGNKKTGIRLSPSNIKNGVSDSDPVATFTYMIEQLNCYDLAFLHLVEPTLPVDHLPQYKKEVTKYFRQFYQGTLITCGGYNGEKAIQALAENHADLVAFGVPFISNPDLVSRIEKDAPFAEADESTFYTGGEKGYLDYPML